jgi:FOG: HPt domain
MYENKKYPDFAKYVDVDAGLARIRGNKNLYKRMLGLFTASEEFAKLDDAISSNDAEASGNIAHAIKGMSGNLSLDDVFHLSETLMGEFRAGNFNEALINQYRESLVITLEIIEDYSNFLDNEG